MSREFLTKQKFPKRYESILSPLMTGKGSSDITIDTASTPVDYDFQDSSSKRFVVANYGESVVIFKDKGTEVTTSNAEAIILPGAKEYFEKGNSEGISYMSIESNTKLFIIEY